MDKLRVGVIGYGFMGKMHANIFSGLPQVELAAVSDLDQARFDSARLPGVDFYPDFKDLLNRKDIDAVSICVSDKNHFEPAMLAAQAGKTIFLEKPIALDMGEARQIVAAARQAKVTLMIGFLLRFEDDTLVNLESTWALPEGNASHLDAYMEILGTQGMAKVDCDYSGLWFSNSAGTLFPDTMHWPQVGANIAGDLKEELTHFVNCALQGKTPLVTGEDGVRSLELAWAIQKSMDTGEVIKF